VWYIFEAILEVILLVIPSPRNRRYSLVLGVIAATLFFGAFAVRFFLQDARGLGFTTLAVLAIVIWGGIRMEQRQETEL
jgi:hypothetical protein